MTAYKCDICGCLFSKKSDNIIDSNSKSKWHVRLGDNNNYVDICPHCVDALQKIIDIRTDINDTEV